MNKISVPDRVAQVFAVLAAAWAVLGTAALVVGAFTLDWDLVAGAAAMVLTGVVYLLIARLMWGDDE